MISSSLLIKILGVSVGAFLVVGVPIIATPNKQPQDQKTTQDEGKAQEELKPINQVTKKISHEEKQEPTSELTAPKVEKTILLDTMTATKEESLFATEQTQNLPNTESGPELTDATSITATVGITSTQEASSTQPENLQTETEKEKLVKFLSGTSVSWISTTEKFSAGTFNQWIPSESEQTYIVNNWSTIIEKMPKEFFLIYMSEYKQTPTIPTKIKDICYLQTNYLKNSNQGELDYINIPFLKNKLSTSLDLDLDLDEKRDTREKESSSLSADLQFLKGLFDTTLPRLKALGFVEALPINAPIDTEPDSLWWYSRFGYCDDESASQEN